MAANWGLGAEIVETTFHSRFRFGFLKYPLFKRNKSKRNGNVPEPSEILGTKKSFPLSLPAS